MIGSSDNATISTLYDADGVNALGFKLTSVSTNDRDNNGDYAQLYFYGKGVKGVTDIDTYWFGRYNDRSVNVFNNCSITTLTDTDSGAAWSWTNEYIGAGETKTYSVIIGIGGADLENFILSGGIDYENEVITGLNPNKDYEITVKDEEGNPTTPVYELTSDGNGEIPLAGTDNNGVDYDFIGDSFTIVEVDSSGNEVSDPQDIEVADRPEVTEPEAPTETPPEVLEAVTIQTTPTSITILTENSQSYAIFDTEENQIGNWIDADSSGKITFTSLDENTPYVIKTYKKATVSAPKSEVSNGVTVKTLNTFEVTENNIYKYFDGNGYSAEVTLATPVDGVQILYATEYNGADTVYDLTEPPTFSTVGNHSVYYCVKNQSGGYYPSYGELEVVINKITISSVTSSGFNIDWIHSDNLSEYKVIVSDNYSNSYTYSSLTEASTSHAKTLYNGRYYTVTLYDKKNTIIGSERFYYSVDDESPVITGVVYGETYETSQKILFTDNIAVTSLKVNGEFVSQMELSNGFIVLPGNIDMTYTITASDIMGNTTTMVYYSKSIVSVADEIKDILSDNVKSDDRETIENIKEELESIDVNNASAEEIQKIQELIDKCNDLLETIEETEATLEEIEQIGQGIPDIDEINTEDKEAVEDAIEKLEEILGDTSNLTPEQIEELEDLKEALGEKLETIEETEATLEEIEQIGQGIPDIDEINTEDKEAVEDAIEKLEEILGDTSNLTPEQIEELEDLKEALEEKLETIEETEATLEEIVNLFEGIPDVKDINWSDKNSVISAIEHIDAILSDDNVKLTEAQIDELKEMRKVLAEKVEFIQTELEDNVPDTNGMSTDGSSAMLFMIFAIACVVLNKKHN